MQRPFEDISFHPDGRLFGVLGSRIYLINQVNGTISLVHDVIEDSFDALTIGINGIMYMMGSTNVWTYDIVTNTSTNLGSTGFASAGDLTFYKGELYLATENAEIARIDLDMPSSSNVVIEADEHLLLLGIVSNIVDCEIKCYATYADTFGNSEVYEIDFENETLQFVCTIPITVYGGASTTEFLGSNPVSTGALLGENPGCINPTGQVSIPYGDGFGNLEYSLNGGPFQSDSIFLGLSAGTYEIHIRDEKGCLDSNTIILTASDQPFIDNISVSHSECNLDNGSIIIFVSGGSYPYMYSIENNDFHLSNEFVNLAPGEYSVIVQDALGCITTQVVAVGSLPQSSIDTIITSSSDCHASTGSLQVFTTGPIGVQYSLDGTSFQTAPFFQNLGPGVYVVTLQDANGCIDTFSTVITGESTPQLEIFEVSPEYCDMANGSIEVIASGGLQPYSTLR